MTKTFYRVEIVGDLPNLSKMWKIYYKKGNKAWAYETTPGTWHIWNGSANWGSVMITAAEARKYIRAIIKGGERETAKGMTAYQLQQDLEYRLSQ